MKVKTNPERHIEFSHNVLEPDHVEYTAFVQSESIISNKKQITRNVDESNVLSPELAAAYDDEHRIHTCHKCESRSILVIMLAFIAYKLWFIMYSPNNIVTEYKYVSGDTTLMPAIMIQSSFDTAFIDNISIEIRGKNSYKSISGENMTQTAVEYNDSTLNIKEHDIDRDEWNVIFFDYKWDQNNTFLMYDTVWIIPPENYGIAANGFVSVLINHGMSPELVNEFYDLDLKYNDNDMDKNKSWQALAKQYFTNQDIFGLKWVPVDSNYLFEYAEMEMSGTDNKDKHKKKDSKQKGPIWSFVFAGTENTIYYDLIEQIDETSILNIFSNEEEEPLRMFTASNTASVESGDIFINDECHIFSNKNKITKCMLYDTVLSISPNPTSQGMNARIIIKHKIEIKELPEIIGGFFHLLERCLEAWIFLPLLFGTICGVAVCKPCGFKGYAPNKSLSHQQKHEMLLFLQELDIIGSETSQINMQKIKSKYQRKAKGICC